jgi:hypothetical protein
MRSIFVGDTGDATRRPLALAGAGSFASWAVN